MAEGLIIQVNNYKCGMVAWLGQDLQELFQGRFSFRQSALQGDWKKVINKFRQAELFLFQHIQLSESEWKCELYVLVVFIFSPVQSELLC